MNGWLLIATAIAGGAGAVLRWAVDGAVTRWVGSRLPWGTLVVNISGSFLLGCVLSFFADPGLVTVVGTGFLGGYTTFSAVAAASALMLDEQAPRPAIANAFGTLVLCVAAAWLGLQAGALCGSTNG